MSDVIRIVIADDQAMVRAGLKLVVESEPGMEVVGEAADGLEAVAVARRTRPDIVLMDISMPRMDGLTAARQLLDQPDPPRVVMLTTFDTDENLYAALRAGTSGFLLKVSPPEQLVEAVRVVVGGDALLDPAVTTRVIASFAGRHEPAPPPRLGELTPRELEVLRFLARGLTNAEIAKELFVGEATVKTHVARVLMKLHLRDRAQAVVFAYESGVVRPGAAVG
ncbi:response regulator transcription factor [Planomonospora sp. ID91781]|uniref:LuxR family transcriptional regulator n=3 Tax=Planomonospora TaxID=1998 RepID=A0A171BGQ9_9ACTN|nr:MULTISPECIES: response regulator transcription factor [Planomonospora]MBG0821816.1 response regulator transcription factor [Planomonospora sp. ID91781]GAT65069.1 luxR family transcriptional regulator [Planomonospora sphaerica]GGK45826.1 DNA-binding response regulator [Planomonospora parontospora]GGL03451.1 DNA-binding response regulator [Planomonospora parontospora subsp. antibiotica]GII06384.1 DNA-binding response regulator [Planomonospora parontospora subsp. parontospora]